MEVPIPYIHKSHSNLIKRCSKQLELKDILKLTPSHINESSLAGSAFHNFTEQIYLSTKTDKWDDWKYWVEFWVNDFQKRKNDVLSKDIELHNAEDIKAEEFAEMIVEFLKQRWNRNAQPILLEAPFRFTLKRGKQTYGFEGRIDQLLKIQWVDLPPHFQRQLLELNSRPTKDYIYLHRDIKTGTRRHMSEIELTCDDNIMYYSYALAYGSFDLAGTGDYSYRPKLIPYAHALYYTRDHLKYKRKTGEHVAGDYKGQGMYFIRKDLDDLKRMEVELINLWRKINSGIYTRDGQATNLCDRYCGFKHMCLHDWNTNGH